MKLTTILKQILNESPEGIHMKDYDLKWYDPHTVTCIYDPNTKISFFAFDSGRIHNEVKNSIAAMCSMGEKGTLKISSDGVWNDETPSSDRDNQVMLRMIHANHSGEHLIEHFVNNTKMDEYRLTYRGRDLVNKGYIFYRAWTLGEDKIVSFWNTREKVSPEYDNILNHLSKFKNISPDEFRSEFEGEFGQFYTDPSIPKTSDKNISDEERKELLARQHLDPLAKKKLKDAGEIPPMKVQKKWWEINEGSIKEDPDRVLYRNSDDDLMYLAYNNEDAVPFTYESNSGICFIGPDGSMHCNIAHVVDKLFDKYVEYKSTGNWVNIRGSSIGLKYKNFNADETVKYMRGKLNRDKFDNDFREGNHMAELGYILGRVWKKSGVISFYNKKAYVIKHLKNFGEMLPSITGNVNLSIKDLEWEFGDDPIPKPININGTVEKPLSDEEYKTLLAKQHIDPKAKEELLKRGLIGAGRGREEPEWTKPFNENKSEIDNIKVSPSDKTKGHEYFQIKDVVTGGHADLDIRPHFNHDALEHDGFEMCVIEFYASPMEDRIFGKDNKRGGFGRNVFRKIFEICAERDISILSIFAPLKDSQDIFKHYTEIGILTPIPYSKAIYGDFHTSFKINRSKSLEYVNKNKKKQIIPETSMKLTKILEELLVETKETYEVENVFLNGKRISGITMASSDKQALSNIIIRNLPSNLKGTIGDRINDAKKIGGHKIKKLPPRSDTPTTNRMPYRDD